MITTTKTSKATDAFFLTDVFEAQKSTFFWRKPLIKVMLNQKFVLKICEQEGKVLMIFPKEETKSANFYSRNQDEEQEDEKKDYLHEQFVSRSRRSAALSHTQNSTFVQEPKSSGNLHVVLTPKFFHFTLYTF